MLIIQKRRISLVLKDTSDEGANGKGDEGDTRYTVEKFKSTHIEAGTEDVGNTRDKQPPKRRADENGNKREEEMVVREALDGKMELREKRNEKENNGGIGGDSKSERGGEILEIGLLTLLFLTRRRKSRNGIGQEYLDAKSSNDERAKQSDDKRVRLDEINDKTKSPKRKRTIEHVAGGSPHARDPTVVTPVEDGALNTQDGNGTHRNGNENA